MREDGSFDMSSILTQVVDGIINGKLKGTYGFWYKSSIEFNPDVRLPAAGRLSIPFPALIEQPGPRCRTRRGVYFFLPEAEMLYEFFVPCISQQTFKHCKPFLLHHHPRDGVPLRTSFMEGLFLNASRVIISTCCSAAGNLQKEVHYGLSQQCFHPDGKIVKV